MITKIELTFKREPDIDSRQSWVGFVEDPTDPTKDHIWTDYLYVPPEHEFAKAAELTITIEQKQ